MLLRHSFPEWLVNMAERQGVSQTITMLTYLASHNDTASADVTYAAYAARLTSWGTTLPNAPSTAVLSAITPLSIPNV
jgi:hypothetical protein